MGNITRSIFFWLSALSLALFILALNFKVGQYVQGNVNMYLGISAGLVLLFLIIGIVTGNKTKLHNIAETAHK